MDWKLIVAGVSFAAFVVFAAGYWVGHFNGFKKALQWAASQIPDVK